MLKEIVLTILAKLAYGYCRVHFQTSDVVCGGSGDGLGLADFPLVYSAQADNLHQVGELYKS